MRRTDSDIGWLNRKFSAIERELRELRAAKKANATTIGSGGLTVTEGGDITVKGGGDIEVHDGGRIQWYDAAGRLRLSVASVVSALGNQLVNLVTYGTGGASATVGSIEDLSSGEVRQGVLVQGADGTDHLSAMAGPQAGDLSIGTDEDDQLDLKDASGNFRATLGPIASEGNPAGYGLVIDEPDGSDVFVAYRGGLEWRGTNGDALVTDGGGGLQWSAGGIYTWEVDRFGHNTRMFGGIGTNGLYELINCNDPSQARGIEVQFRDGADSTYIPVAADQFLTPSQAADKQDVRDPEPDALGRVLATPVKRWRRAQGPAGSGGGEQQEPLDQIGPLAEDAPQHVADWRDPDDGMVSLNGAVWTLWQAVQEQQATIEGLRAEVASLRAVHESQG